jgi:predicted O-methyltransferase YrrM
MKLGKANNNFSVHFSRLSYTSIAALMALKRKKRLESMLRQLDGTLTTVEMQRETLEQAKDNVAVLQAMKSAAASLQYAQKNL